jgi:hypothetical protein
MRHGSEAVLSAIIFRTLSTTSRQRLLTFLESL